MRFKETDSRFKETDKKFEKMIGKLGDRWGEFVEGIVAPAAVRLFRERGIEINLHYNLSNVIYLIELKKNNYFLPALMSGNLSQI